jgi:restriction endonuclease S subunit
MMMGWQKKTLADVCLIKPPKSEARERATPDSLVTFSPMEDLGIDRKFLNAKQVKPLASVIGSYTYFADGDVLLAKITPCFENGKLGIATGLSNGIGFGSSEFIVFRPCQSLDKEYLYYYLSRPDFREEGASRMGGAVGQQRVSKEFIENYPILLPSLSEQQQIVGILDKAFEGIATAKANAEKNLQNARAIFESQLNSVFSHRGDGWVEKAFDEICEISSVLVDPRQREYLNLPHVGGANIVSKTGELVELKTAKEEKLISPKFVFDETMVLYSKIRPYLMKVSRPDFQGLCSADIYPLSVKAGQLDRNYLFYLLLSPEFTEYAISGSARAGMPKVNRDHLFAFHVHLPSIAKQRQFAGKLDNLYKETQRLESIYQKKLTALEELKKSLLHQAFTGQLTTSNLALSESTAQQFPMEVEGISTTDLHAGILAMAYELHEKAGKLQYFAHVKAEKIAHMVEAKLGISLGRNPVKDAAGPNDFKHLLGVEHRARMAKYFDFKEVQEGRHELRKLGGFNRLIDKTRTALGSRLADVEHLLTWMLPMNMQQAEIVATVYAAWNNLLLDGKQPTDEEIVYEARENWHSAKLKIVRDKFFTAVQWMREQKVIPEGKGPRVDKKGK